MSDEIKIEEFLKDKLSMKYYYANQKHCLTSNQLKELLADFRNITIKPVTNANRKPRDPERDADARQNS